MGCVFHGWVLVVFWVVFLGGLFSRVVVFGVGRPTFGVAFFWVVIFTGGSFLGVGHPTFWVVLFHGCFVFWSLWFAYCTPLGICFLFTSAHPVVTLGGITGVYSVRSKQAQMSPTIHESLQGIP